MKIVNIKAREIIDSRGYPTVEVEMLLEDNTLLRSAVPSGASTGEREGIELRDNDLSRYHGYGVLKAVSNVNKIIRDNLIDKDIEGVDSTLLSLDRTNNKSELGVNAVLPVSLCASKYIVKNSEKNITKVPKIMCNILNGGVHADNDLDIQEFMIVPFNDNIKESIRMSSEVFHTLKRILKEKGYSTSVGDEGGFSPNISSTEEALDLLILAIKESNYIPGKDIYLALDIAGTQLYSDNYYYLDNKKYDKDSYLNKLISLIEKYPIISIEDPFDENDYDSHSKLTELIGDEVMVVGDDLFTTNVNYLRKGIAKNSCNAILIKPNQIGTIKEVEDTIKLARKNNYKIIFSHRSGETEDSFIADLAVYYDTDYVKFGSLSRGERTAKYNELLRIFES